MVYEYRLKTEKYDMIRLDSQLQDAIEKSGVTEGTAVIYCPHTTAAITINENADPDVIHDLIMATNEFFPPLEGYKHMEGNSPAHLKSSLVGVSETVIVTDGKPLLGVWQSPFFWEFDGPRNRKFYIKVIPD